MRAKLLTAAAVVAMAIGLLGAPAHGHAQPRHHEHFMTVPGNGMEVQVGPHVCELPQLGRAFHEFHSNVHIGQPGHAMRVEFCPE